MHTTLRLQRRLLQNVCYIFVLLLFVICYCYVLFVMYCLLFVVCCLLFVVCCLLFVVCCLLFVVCCFLFFICYLLFVIYCLLLVVCCCVLFVSINIAFRMYYSKSFHFSIIQQSHVPSLPHPTTFLLLFQVYLSFFTYILI